MKSRRKKIPVWMVLKLILSPDEYASLKNRARAHSQNVAEFVKQLIGHCLKTEKLKA